MTDELSRQLSNVNIYEPSDPSLYERTSDVGSQSDEFVDENESRTEYSDDVKPTMQEDIKPMIQFQVIHPEMPPMFVERKNKKEEREVKHRFTGRISVENLRRRRLLSVSADNATRYLRNLSQQNIQIARNRSESPYLRSQSLSAARQPSASVSTIVRQDLVLMPSVQPTATLKQSQSTTQLAPSQPTSQLAPSPNQGQQRQIQKLIQMINNEAFCEICDQQYSTRQSLMKHKKTPKHLNNQLQMDSTRKQLFKLAYAQANANQANSQ